MWQHKGTIASVGGEDTCFSQRNGEMAFEMVKQVGDVSACGDGVVKLTSAGIGGAHDSSRLPGNDEEDALVISLWQDDSAIPKLDIFAGEHQVHAFAWFN